MTASVIKHVDQLGSKKPAMLTWTNRCGEIIVNGQLWDTRATSSNDASATSAVAGATEMDDDHNVVAVAEEDWEMPTTDVDVVDNIKGVDNTQEVYEVWNKDVPVDVDNQINNDGGRKNGQIIGCVGKMRNILKFHLLLFG
jgi:hypothetical protein